MDSRDISNGKSNGRRSSTNSSFKYHETSSPENIDELIRQKEHILKESLTDLDNIQARNARNLRSFFLEYCSKTTKGLSGLSIDHMSRKAFPIAFAIFNIFYWAICCSVPKEDLPDDCIIQPIKTQP